jgi:hypothetical protein
MGGSAALGAVAPTLQCAFDAFLFLSFGASFVGRGLPALLEPLFPGRLLRAAFPDQLQLALVASLFAAFIVLLLRPLADDAFAEGATAADGDGVLALLVAQ